MIFALTGALNSRPRTAAMSFSSWRRLLSSSSCFDGPAAGAGDRTVREAREGSMGAGRGVGTARVAARGLAGSGHIAYGAAGPVPCGISGRGVRALATFLEE